MIFDDVKWLEHDKFSILLVFIDNEMKKWSNLYFDVDIRPEIQKFKELYLPCDHTGWLDRDSHRLLMNPDWRKIVWKPNTVQWQNRCQLCCKKICPFFSPCFWIMESKIKSSMIFRILLLIKMCVRFCISFNELFSPMVQLFVGKIKSL